ncbi:G-protein coupled receptor 84 [Brachionichthys hirsutus]|uniref:G-protein coupled receptor 84 n=1 Tax=Brachionichthys hirsutus TaxID=412623 RepID=UPI003604B4CB
MNRTNQTQLDPFSCHSPAVEVYRYVAVLWGCAVAITGTIGNLMTVLAFVLDPHLRTRFNVLIVNLAVADLLYCTVLQPISVDSYLHLRWRSGPTWCRVFGLLLFLSNSVSIITLCLVAVSRYLLVAQRAVFDRVSSRWGLITVLVSSWALALASFGPLWSVYVFVPQVCTCSFHRTRGRPYTTILLLFYFCIGLGFVGVFYFLIYRRVKIASAALLRYRPSRRSSRRKPVPSADGTDDSGAQSQATNTSSCETSSRANASQSDNAGEKDFEQASASSGSKPPRDAIASSGSKPPRDAIASSGSKPPRDAIASSGSKPPRDAIASSGSKPPRDAIASSHAASGDDGEFKRVTRMCFAVFLCFVFCFVPFLLLNMADKDGRAPLVLHMLCANLTWLNSCVNPVLYAVMNRQFRQAYQVLLSRAAAPLACLWPCRRAQTS